MEASEPKWGNLILIIIGVNSLWLGGLHIVVFLLCSWGMKKFILMTNDWLKNENENRPNNQSYVKLTIPLNQLKSNKYIKYNRKLSIVTSLACDSWMTVSSVASSVTMGPESCTTSPSSNRSCLCVRFSMLRVVCVTFFFRVTHSSEKKV